MSVQETRLVDLYEAQHDEGPCLDCFRTGQAVSPDDLPTIRAAWPAFTLRLEEVGFQSAQAVPTADERGVPGDARLLT